MIEQAKRVAVVVSLGVAMFTGAGCKREENIMPKPESSKPVAKSAAPESPTGPKRLSSGQKITRASDNFCPLPSDSDLADAMARADAANVRLETRIAELLAGIEEANMSSSAPAASQPADTQKK